MRALFVLIVFSLLCSPISQGSLYSYPEDKRPAVSLKDACAIGDTILGKLGLDKGAYINGVVILGDEGQTGAGTWTLHYRNEQGDKIRIAIYFPEDFCIVMISPKVGDYSEKGFTRDGQVSPKWIEWQAKMKKEEEDQEKAWGPTDPVK